MRKLLILILYLTIAQCASVYKRVSVYKRETGTQEYAKSEGEGTKKVEDIKDIKDNQSQNGNEPINKENPTINYPEQFQTLYYMVPLGTEILYPAETLDMPVVYYIK